MRWQGKGDYARVEPFRVEKAPDYIPEGFLSSAHTLLTIGGGCGGFSRKTVYNNPQKSGLE